MGKIYKACEKVNEESKLRMDETVQNFMGGDSYKVNPLDTLKMISASSIFGEPSYYRDSNISRTKYSVDNLLSGFSTIPSDYVGLKTEEVVESAIDDALSYDFEGTLKWASELRNNYYIRLNPQIIIVRAAMHPGREVFTANAKEGAFRKYAMECMARPDDCMSGMTYYMYCNKGKKGMPSILKRAYAQKLSGLSAYQVSKYKNAELGMINAVRICHANSTVINELMSTGTVEVDENEMTWERLHSEGKPWDYILKSIEMGHMALLRNLRNFFSEVEDTELRTAYLEKLKNGVLKGKQFPYRYYTAYNAVKSCGEIKNKTMVLDALEECMDISVDNMPKLKGRTVVLTDNSGSAWGAVTTEYGSVTVAEIDNLSAVITAATSDEGVVVKFGDTIRVFEISKRRGILEQAIEISKEKHSDVGGNTEGGVWEFFRDAIKNKDSWDNIFIYSDQQAGHAGLYGTRQHKMEYKEIYGCNEHINVFKLLLDYRKHVNKKVNVFSVQTAGYDNNVLPEYAYRTNLMYGWTGRESVFADIMIKQWDSIESKN